MGIYQPMTTDKKNNNVEVTDIQKNEQESNNQKEAFDPRNLQEYISSMQDIFGNLCDIMSEADKNNKEEIDTDKVSGVFEKIAGSLEKMVGKDDKMYQTLEKDIKKMKKELKKENKAKRKKAKKEKRA